MLQEAVDALIDNSARRGQEAVIASTGQKRQLKSLADMLKVNKAGLGKIFWVKELIILVVRLLWLVQILSFINAACQKKWPLNFLSHLSSIN